MKIMIVTDAWEPQINGVVHTLSTVIAQLRADGHQIEMITPSDGYWTVPLPTYPDIRLAPFAKKDIERRIIEFGPEAIHIATEGPIGLAVRASCLKWKMPFTTSYHTKFPEYLKARFPFIPLALPYKFARDFHNSGGRIMVSTPSMIGFLKKRGFKNLVPWARGVDTHRFHPRKRKAPTDIYAGLPRPVFLNVGRISIEKNLNAFLDLDLPGSKVVVGEGPQLLSLKKQYPDVHFMGLQKDDELVRYYADADVFVFPSKTDTFGLVILEAMATGTPVAALPVTGPIDIIPSSGAGVIDTDLQKAALACLHLDRAATTAYAQNYNWSQVSETFLSYLTPEYEPVSRRRWRRMRRMMAVAQSPYHIIKRPLGWARQWLQNKWDRKSI